MVSITLRVLSKPDPFKLPFIYRRLGKGERGGHGVGRGHALLSGRPPPGDARVLGVCCFL